MIYIEQLLQLALAGTFTNGLWPGRARDDIDPPYGTFIAFSNTNHYLSDVAGDQNVLVQIDVWAATQGEVVVLADAVEAAMRSHNLNASPTMFTSTQIRRQIAPPDPGTELRRIVLEFSVWFRPLADVAAGFSPTSVAGLAAWFRKGLGISSIGGIVSQWDDASGFARHLIQGTGSRQPQLQSDGTIFFDGSADALKCAPFTLNQPCSIYVLFKGVTWTAGDRIFGGDAGAVGELQQSPTTPRLAFNASAGNDADNPDLAVGAYGAVAVVFDGAASVIQVNGNAATVGNPGAVALAGFTLGTRGAVDSAFSNIQVAEVLIYTGAHTLAQRTEINAYLMGMAPP